MCCCCCCHNNACLQQGWPDGNITHIVSSEGCARVESAFTAGCARPSVHLTVWGRNRGVFSAWEPWPTVWVGLRLLVPPAACPRSPWGLGCRWVGPGVMVDPVLWVWLLAADGRRWLWVRVPGFLPRWPLVVAGRSLSGPAG